MEIISQLLKERVMHFKDLFEIFAVLSQIFLNYYFLICIESITKNKEYYCDVLPYE